VRRALVTLPEGAWKAIDELKGTLGDGDSEVIRNIVIAQLTSRGILLPSYNVPTIASEDFKHEIKKQQKTLEALIGLLVDKGYIQREDLRKRSSKSDLEQKP
jgi:hypothetical protein